MSEWNHGAYGDQQVAANKTATRNINACVVVGTAPVHTVYNGAKYVNKPVVVNDIAEARKYFGYDDDWENYTLCEAMHVFFELVGVGPLVMINVLDPEKHKSDATKSKTLTPENGRMVIAGAESVILDTVKVGEKVLGTDYAMSYNYARKSLVITEAKHGALGTEALEITWSEIDAAAIAEEDVIGGSDGNGLNTGIYCMKNVYQETGYVPSMLLVPGYSSVPAVHKAMYQNCMKINKHWDAWMFADLPLMDAEGTGLTLDSAHTWRTANGYNMENETVCFPMAEGTDGKYYHLSVLRAANKLKLEIANDGIPYFSASNTDAPIVRNLWMGEENRGRVWDDEIVNEKLCKNGITSAAYIGGRWALWGASAADYDAENGDSINMSETARMMLYYVSNDFQHRRARDVDKPLSSNDIQTIVAEEQARLDALVNIGALTYANACLKADAAARSDMYMGDYMFMFNVTTMPLAKSLTAVVNWVDDGFVTYFADYANV